MGADMKPKSAVAYVVSGSIIVLFLVLFLPRARPFQEPDNVKEKNQRVKLIPSLEGVDIFRSYCASCHGLDGKGEGPVAPALIAKLPDLTTISQRNGGIFPGKRIERLISGDEIIIAHGSREMPIWGPIFHQIEEDRDFGNVRLHNLTSYLETIQKK